MGPSYVRIYTQKLSPTWLPKHELNKDGNNRHGKVDGERPEGLKELEMAVKSMGPSYNTLQILDIIGSICLTPYDCHQTAK